MPKIISVPNTLDYKLIDIFMRKEFPDFDLAPDQFVHKFINTYKRYLKQFELKFRVVTQTDSKPYLNTIHIWDLIYISIEASRLIFQWEYSKDAKDKASQGIALYEVDKSKLVRLVGLSFQDMPHEYKNLLDTLAMTPQSKISFSVLRK